nr:tetratricopeptide repeat protein [Membranihabitans maritimus]
MFIDAESKKLTGDIEAAKAIYKQILENDPNDDVAAFFLGVLYLEGETFKEASNYFSLALANEKNNPWYYLRATEAYLKNDQFDNASSTLKKLIEHFPDNPEYYDRLEYLYRDSNQFKKQLDLINTMIEKFGFHKDYGLSRVQALDNMGKQDRAVEELEELRLKFPRDKFILNLLANFYKKNGQEEKALTVYRDILNFAPDDPQANLEISKFNSKDQTEIQKIRSLEGLFRKKTIDFDAKFSRIATYFQNGLEHLDSTTLQSLDTASDWLLEAHPDNPKALSLKADLLSRKGENPEAVIFYKKTIDVHPDNYMVWEQLLWSLKELHRWKELVEFADQGTLYFPNKSSLYLMKSTGLFHLNDFDEAIFEIEYAERLALNDPIMLSNILALKGLILCSSGTSGAHNTFSDAKKQLDSNPNISYMESQCAVKSGDLDLAMELMESALNKVPTKPEYIVLYSKILIEKNNSEKALELLLKASNNTKYFPVFETISDIYQKKGNSEKADQFQQLAVKYGKSDPIKIKN